MSWSDDISEAQPPPDVLIAMRHVYIARNEGLEPDPKEMMLAYEWMAHGPGCEKRDEEIAARVAEIMRDFRPDSMDPDSSPLENDDE